MFGQYHPVHRPDHQAPSHNSAGEASLTLQQACADLSLTLSDLGVRQAALDAAISAGTSDDEIGDALDGVRAVRRRCTQTAEMVRQLRPMTPEEVGLKRGVLDAYCTQLEVDHMVRQFFLASRVGLTASVDPAAPPAAVSPVRHSP